MHKFPLTFTQLSALLCILKMTKTTILFLNSLPNNLGGSIPLSLNQIRSLSLDFELLQTFSSRFKIVYSYHTGSQKKYIHYPQYTVKQGFLEITTHTFRVLLYSWLDLRYVITRLKTGLQSKTRPWLVLRLVQVNLGFVTLPTLNKTNPTKSILT